MLSSTTSVYADKHLSLFSLYLSLPDSSENFFYLQSLSREQPNVQLKVQVCSFKNCLPKNQSKQAYAIRCRMMQPCFFCSAFFTTDGNLQEANEKCKLTLGQCIGTCPKIHVELQILIEISIYTIIVRFQLNCIFETILTVKKSLKSFLSYL